MKKRKFNILLNIATLCLCITAIAFGVYSAKTASLNVSGTIGFTAHNVKAKIEGFITNYADSADGAIVTTDTQIIADGGLALNGGDASFNLGATKGTGTATRYFSDLGTSGNPEDIIVKIKITNTSDFDILVNVDMANCKATTTALENIIKVDYDKSAVVLAKNENTTFTFNIKLLPNADGSYGNTALTTPTSNNIQLKMNLEKSAYTQSQVKTDAPIKQFTTTEIKSIKTGLGSASVQDNTYEYGDTYKCYAERYPYYIEMGERNNEKVKWLIVGAFNNNKVTALTDSDKTPLSQGYMLKDTTYVMLSEKVLYTESNTESTTNYGISFQNKYTNSGSYLNDYGYSAQDYATSNIRNYLKGADDVYRSYTYDSTTKQYSPDKSKSRVNLLTDYNLTSDPIYAKIQGRTLTSLYNESAITNETKEMKTVPTTKSGYTAVNFTGNTEDKLWLLSQTEMEEIFKADYVEGSRETHFYPVYMSSRTSVLGASSSASWWLRSPCSYHYDYVSAVHKSSLLRPDVAYVDEYGSRAAFLF